jgi:hypothetical protein
MRSVVGLALIFIGKIFSILEDLLIKPFQNRFLSITHAQKIEVLLKLHKFILKHHSSCYFANVSSQN